MNIGLTLFGQTIAFGVFVWIVLRHIWPPIMSAMAERQKTIAEGLEAAERAKRDLELAGKRAADELEAAREEAAALIEAAHQRAAKMIDEAKDDARTEGEKIKEATQAEIALEVSRAKEALRAQVAVLAVAGAEQILERSVDEQAHSELLGKLAAQL